MSLGTPSVEALFPLRAKELDMPRQNGRTPRQSPTNKFAQRRQNRRRENGKQKTPRRRMKSVAKLAEAVAWPEAREDGS